MKNLFISILWLGTCFHLNLVAQPNPSSSNSRFVPKEFNFSAHYGYIINHQDFVGHLTTSHPAGFELSAYWLTTGKYGWEKAYRYPKIGVSFFYYDFRNPVLGNAFAIVPHMKWTWKKTKRTRLEFKIGPGVVYTPNPWTVHSNPKNVMFSSILNNVMYTGLEYSYRISPRIKLNTGVHLSHYSNAAYSLPNAGINIPSVNLGVTYTPHSEKVVYKDTLKPYDKNWSFHFSASGSLLELDANQPRKNHLVGFIATANKRLSRKSIVNIGLEYSHNTALEKYANRIYSRAQLPIPDFRRAGLLVGHELISGRVALVTQLGVYIYRPFTETPEGGIVDQPIYQRFGVKYYINKNLFAQYTFRTHLGVAEAIEYTIGYCFSAKK
ncbi:MAG TPA: hypothetical protein DCS93_07665 [Microscillaceae bacterium]|nr:hypothetical protein [Microscillaceae bacterium]